ncbi:MAG: GTP 3',8-cyclase MoaA [Lachnospiraceae bacterium]|jgi:cyclic pyranopterin phosphate synthase
MTMIDNYGRRIDYMRVSITDRCNLRCQYCMPKDLPDMVSPEDILTYEEIYKIVKSAVEAGITKFKVTGGEPLVRKGCVSFVEKLKNMPGVEAVTLTTNGVLLHEMLPALRDAGVDGINISLDTLKEERFRQITGFSGIQKVIESIKESTQMGIRTKVNCVLMKDVNEDEILDFIRISEKFPVDVRFIEMMPIGYGKGYAGIDSSRVLEILQSEYAHMEPVREKRGNGPALYIHPEGFRGCVGWIDAIHGKFCDQCNRIRLTCQGLLKPCLYYQEGTDLRSAVRGNVSQKELTELIRQTILKKPQEHHFGEKRAENEAEEKRMSQIGG